MTPEPDKRSGGCLCGKVRFTVAIKKPLVHVCHCSMCRKWGNGGPAMSVDCEEELEVEGDHLRWYRSSEWAERGFCAVCGSSLFYRLIGQDHYMNVSAASLDDDSDLEIKEHIFIDSKPFYYDFADFRPRLTEEEFLKKFEEERHDTGTN